MKISTEAQKLEMDQTFTTQLLSISRHILAGFLCSLSHQVEDDSLRNGQMR